MKERIVLVTGGVRGIGSSISEKFLASGDFVIVIATNEDKNNEWCQKQKKYGYNKVAAYKCNLASFQECENTLNTIAKKYGKIDVLVNNAGITRDSLFKNMTREQWHSVVDINLNSIYNITRFVILMMLERNVGRIINISSLSGQKGNIGQCNYSATKAAVHAFTRSLALEVASKGITVNTVSPGFIKTDMTMNMKKEVLEKFINKIPIGRLGLPEEIADAVYFLSSDNASYITGSDFSINGGLGV